MSTPNRHKIIPQPEIPAVGLPYSLHADGRTGKPLPAHPLPNRQGHHHRRRHHSSSRERDSARPASSHDHQPQSSHSHSHHSTHSHRNPAPAIVTDQRSEPIASHVPQVFPAKYAPVHNHRAIWPLSTLFALRPSADDPRHVPERGIQRSPIPSRSRSPDQQARADSPTWNPEPLIRPSYQYARCIERKKAVCVGINYTGTPDELSGCQNDAASVYRYLVDDRKYPPDRIMFLTDATVDPRVRPTCDVLLNAMKWLVEDVRPGDSLFFHYSGHGGRIPDLDGDETDGYDEAIIPLDHETAGIITDDDMHDIMVAPLPPGCRFTGLFDVWISISCDSCAKVHILFTSESCHSGSILDLVYNYHSNGRLKASRVSRRFRKKRQTPADVISWSACKDSQMSADTTEDGFPVGAMSYAFIKTLKRNPGITHRDLLRGVREVIVKRYGQKPQLSSSHKIDTELYVML